MPSRRDSRKFGTQGDELDFALLVDGLAAEREQKITIDVAYRFFATARRKFIVIDAPGHEQYTANMATGASVADLALVLVSADEGLTRQTRRHALVLSMLGVRDVVLAVNKMDRVGWSEPAFRTLEKDFHEFAAALGIDRIVAIPLAAKSGDNVTSRSAHMPWYTGPSLLEYLEDVEPVRAPQRQSFRMPIQWVSRPNADFRGYSGLIARGEVHAGMAVKILPSGRVTRIARIATFDGDLERAATGRSVTLTFADHVDASRGDVVVGIEAAPTLTDRIAARLFWMGSEPIEPGRRYLLKLATTTVAAKIEPDVKVFDLDARRLIAAAAIAQNEIGLGTLTDRPPDRGRPLHRMQGYRQLHSHRPGNIRHGRNGLRRGRHRRPERGRRADAYGRYQRQVGALDRNACALAGEGGQLAGDWKPRHVRRGLCHHRQSEDRRIGGDHRNPDQDPDLLPARARLGA